MKILVLNGGSSSHKVSVYELGEDLPAYPPAPLWEGKIEWRDHIRDDAVEQFLTNLWSSRSQVLKSPDDIDVVGHRIVHGGQQYEEPVRITPAVKAGIAAVSEFAPLHNRGELETIEAIEKLLKNVPQVAVFDTGFHRRIPPAAAVYPGPYEWFTRGIRR
jgi:acetate kinase